MPPRKQKNNDIYYSILTITLKPVPIMPAQNPKRELYGIKYIFK